VIGDHCIKLRHVAHGREACMAAASSEHATTTQTGSFDRAAADGREPNLDFLICA